MSDYWRTICENCRHIRGDHDCGEKTYCNLNECDCPRFVESGIVAVIEKEILGEA